MRRMRGVRAWAVPAGKRDYRLRASSRAEALFRRLARSRRGRAESERRGEQKVERQAVEARPGSGGGGGGGMDFSVPMASRRGEARRGETKRDETRTATVRLAVAGRGHGTEQAARRGRGNEAEGRLDAGEAALALPGRVAQPKVGCAC
ncbi:hypothetical protein HDV57DRAFT_489958 [Trichoderma longibrachiatum]|uniref:Uncharacterized protein n=1 Tax=Trichoderma longibrachiatum ATCC 18648 TaxID=983965 RepID=A0A2T4C4I5_TRILO|nr:hypothetical protein M440DRAFT_321465 [Trichoderma longibrachiatum ATCC 18648]